MVCWKISKSNNWWRFSKLLDHGDNEVNDVCKNQIRKRFVKFQQVSSDIGK